jgi:hypothetical protein
MEAGGYDKREFWSAQDWRWRMGKWDSKAPENFKNWLKGRPAEKRNEPFYWHDPKWNNPLAPAVVVGWFEADRMQPGFLKIRDLRKDGALLSRHPGHRI